MKTRVETIQVPAESYERTHFGCEHCDFEDEDKDNFLRHYAKNHAVKKETEVAGLKLMWFDSKEDAELWLDPPGDYTPHDSSEVQWVNPGWYVHESSFHRGGCRCGGCERYYVTLWPADIHFKWWAKEIEENEKKITEAKAKVEELKKLLNPEVH